MWHLLLTVFDLAVMTASGFMWGRLYEKKYGWASKHLDLAMEGWEKALVALENTSSRLSSIVNKKV